MKPYLIAAGNIAIVLLQYIALGLLFLGAVAIGFLKALTGAK